jgi:D-alanyl-D-alanine carboxypeptidase/D-alanyl-D-alanine-endopeptidase (penicillin-binding protein 4)
VTRIRLVVALAAALAGVGLPACATRVVPGAPAASASAPTESTSPDLRSDLDRIFEAPALAGALLAVHVESLRDGQVLYSRNAASRVVPASTLKIVTAAVAADRLGWTHRFETRLEVDGPVVDGILHGDVIVVGGGDPTINAQDLLTAPLFEQWAEALREVGVRRVRGRIIGDDTAYDDEPLGAGWAWDYLTATYAAPSGALSYNENLVAVRVSPGAVAGAPALVRIGPPGHGLTIRNDVRTAAAGAVPSLSLERLPGSTTLALRGQVPQGGADIVRATTIANPTAFFVEGLRLALGTRGIETAGGSVDIDDVPAGARPSATRRLIARHQSPPLSSLVAQMMKVSQNFYGEMLIKAIGRTAEGADGIGSTERGRQVVRRTLQDWSIPVDALVMSDGSGLSRYNYASTKLLVDVLRRMWHDERDRSPFVASLPVAGHDGTLGARMTDVLRRRVQAKTGTITNVRSLAGYVETTDGEKVAFAIIANHFVATNAEVDAVMEEALARIATGATGSTGTTGDR